MVKQKYLNNTLIESYRTLIEELNNLSKSIYDPTLYVSVTILPEKNNNETNKIIYHADDSWLKE